MGTIEMLLLLCAFVLLQCGYVVPHGRLILPAARNCMWRFGFPNPKNWNDNELFCGGRDRMWKKNHGKCGVCGDPYDAKVPRPNEDGGKYSNGIIAKTYKKGQMITVTVHLTTSHLGFFEFRIGDFSDGKKTAGDARGKLLGSLMKLEDRSTKFTKVRKTGKYTMKLQLPADLTCKRCVIQWWYTGGNNWGCDKTGCATGKGPQETFVNCADVTINA